MASLTLGDGPAEFTSGAIDAKNASIAPASPVRDHGQKPAGAALGRAFWREALAPYARPHLGRSALDIATSVVPYLALSALMYLALDVSYLLTLALALPAAGFLVRTYIVFHDCTHGSFLPSKRANAWLGTTLGLLVFSTFGCWRTTTPCITPRPAISIAAE